MHTQFLRLKFSLKTCLKNVLDNVQSQCTMFTNILTIDYTTDQIYVKFFFETLLSERV